MMIGVPNALPPEPADEGGAGERLTEEQDPGDDTSEEETVDETAEGFRAALAASGAPAGKALYSIYTGLSPLAAEEILYEAGVDALITVNVYSLFLLTILPLSFTQWRNSLVSSA